MKSRKIKTEISEKLKNVCEELSEKERKGVLVGMLVTSTVLCGITVARAFGRFLSHGTQKELPFERNTPFAPSFIASFRGVFPG